MYTHVYTYIHTYIYTSIHIHVCNMYIMDLCAGTDPEATGMCLQIYRSTGMYLNICIHMYAHTGIHVYIYIHTDMYVYSYMYVCIYMLICKCMYVYTYMHTFTHKGMVCGDGWRRQRHTGCARTQNNSREMHYVPQHTPAVYERAKMQAYGCR